MNEKLEYQSAEAGRSWRWGRWAFVVTMIALVVGAWKVAPEIGRRLALVKLQDQCLRDLPPPGQAVFDTRPDSLPTMRRSDPRLVSSSLPWWLFASLRQNPDGGGVSLDSVSYIGWLPAEWNQFLVRSGATPTNALALVAVRLLRSPAGHHRVVAIELGGSGAVLPRVFEPASPLRPPVEVATWASLTPLGARSESFAITCDPPGPTESDTITFHVIDGVDVTVWRARLGDDDHIELSSEAEDPFIPPPPTSQASSH